MIAEQINEQLHKEIEQLKKERDEALAKLREIGHALLATDCVIQGESHEPDLVFRAKQLIHERAELRAKCADFEREMAAIRETRHTLPREQEVEPQKRIPGCQHGKKRMVEWLDEGACPVCLTATLGMANEEIARLTKERDDARAKCKLLRHVVEMWQETGPDEESQQYVDAALKATLTLGESGPGLTSQFGRITAWLEEARPDTEFFVIRLKDKHAAPALAAYARSAFEEDPEFGQEVMDLAKQAAEHPNKKQPD